jgi:hypothetical protein
MSYEFSSVELRRVFYVMDSGRRCAVELRWHSSGPAPMRLTATCQCRAFLTSHITYTQRSCRHTRELQQRYGAPST